MKPFDLTGQRFGRLIALERVDAPGESRWNCRCDCGGEKTVLAYNLRIGATQSCGCLHRERIRAANTTHGHTTGGKSSRTYRSWRHMRERCTNPKDQDYPNYGGRGIAVCERWKTFENFLADMGETPVGRSIDRIDVNGDYEPGNCRWATNREQSLNTRSNRILTVNGQSRPMVEWAELMGLSPATILKRLKRGWSIEEAVFGRAAEATGEKAA